MLQSPPVVLTIAGFDPSSGAGITADIKTIAAHGCYGVSAITALTVQSTRGVHAVSAADPALLTESLEELAADVKIAAVHVGMLGSGPVALAVYSFLERFRFQHVVLDPVLKATSGAELLDEEGRTVLAEKLIPLAAVVTPNVAEAAVLTGSTVSTVDDMRKAAARLQEIGAKSVVITGGHLEQATDLLSMKNGEVQIFKAERIQSSGTHGTGCAYSTSIACHLAQGRTLPEAVLLAKAYITAAIGNAYPVGKGNGPVNHMYRMKNHPGGFAKKAVSVSP